jgi:serine/threonine protein kinase
MSRKRRLFTPGARVEEFEVIEQIGSGGYGDIYAVLDTMTEPPDVFAMKVEYFNPGHSLLAHEAYFLQCLQHSAYFPKLIAAGTGDEFLWIVMELLGPSLSVTRRALLGRRFTAYSVLQLAKEMLNCIYMLHRKGLTHRDIKPGNFLIRPDRRRPLCLIDFGLSISYLDPQTRKHISFESGHGFAGTCRYASLNTHRGFLLSRRDDLFSWFYSVAELASGNLPWPGTDDRVKTGELKGSVAVEELCRDLPIEFAQIYNYLLTIKFDQKPNYRFINRKLSQAIKRGVFSSRRFDWEYLRPDQTHVISKLHLEMADPDDKDQESVIPVGCGCFA